MDRTFSAKSFLCTQRGHASRKTGRELFTVALLLILAGGILRTYNFWKPALWLDEYGTWWAVAAGSWENVWHRAWHVHGQTPLYYLLVYLSTQVLGETPFALRLPSLVFGIALLGLAYRLGLDILHRRFAALAGLSVFAVNSFLIFYSQEARPYSLALFSAALSCFFYLRLQERESLGLRVGYVTSLAATIYAHYLFGVVVLIQFIHLSIFHRGAWIRSKSWVLSFAGLGLMCIPAGIHVVSLFERRKTLDWIPPSEGYLAPLKLAIEFVQPVVLAATALSMLLVGLRASPRHDLPARRRLVFLWLWFLAPFAFVSVAPLLFHVSLLHMRYVLVALPAGLLLFGYFISHVSPKRGLRYLPVMVLFFTSMTWTLLPSLETNETFSLGRPTPGSGWKQAAAHLERVARKRDLILYRSGFVEADQYADGLVDPLFESWMSWPIAAHWKPSKGFTMKGLPYRLTDHTFPYMAELFEQATQYPRIWVVGRGDMPATVAKTLLQRPDCFLGSQNVYKGITVIRIDRKLAVN